MANICDETKQLLVLYFPEKIFVSILPQRFFSISILRRHESPEWRIVIMSNEHCVKVVFQHHLNFQPKGYRFKTRTFAQCSVYTVVSGGSFRANRSRTLRPESAKKVSQNFKNFGCTSSLSYVGSGIVPVDGAGGISHRHCLYHASPFRSITCILFHQSIFLHLILYLLFHVCFGLPLSLLLLTSNLKAFTITFLSSFLKTCEKPYN